MIFSLLHNADITQEAMGRLGASPQAIVLLGEPIEKGWLITGSINYNNRTGGNAQLEIPVSGSTGREGVLFVKAHTVDDQWTFDMLELEVDGKPLNLLKGPLTAD